MRKYGLRPYFLYAVILCTFLDREFWLTHIRTMYHLKIKPIIRSSYRSNYAISLSMDNEALYIIGEGLTEKRL